MDCIDVYGGRPLEGDVILSGAKNAALPLLIASLLTDAVIELKHVPDLKDIRTTLALLQHLGVEIEHRAGAYRLSAANVACFEAPYELVSTMRASVLVLGPLLARFGQVKVSLPGGCAIGARPIQYHLMGLEKLGAEIWLENGYVIAKANRLKGTTIRFDFPSVGATENILMAAVLAEGETVLENCACEPEIVDLANLLIKMGAYITGAGTSTILIRGVTKLHEATHAVMGDRIEAGTFALAVCGTGGAIRVMGIAPEALGTLLAVCEQCGAQVERFEDGFGMKATERMRAASITTEPYPGFPTDMQAQFMALMSVAGGRSYITETIFENRFMHCSELARLGADISVGGGIATVRGVPALSGAEVMATDLRASASLILGGLFAHGCTRVNRIYHLDRGYERIEEKFRALGARIERRI